ncbi:MAG: hypothetical protein GX900_07520 [Clostridiaceae bacterium]|nr:hypothetical protein [Clostridiaceae bacterium]
MSDLTKEEIAFVTQNVANSNSLTVAEIYDELYDLTIKSMDMNDDPTDQTYYIERIMDKLFPFAGKKWTEIALVIT